MSTIFTRRRVISLCLGFLALFLLLFGGSVRATDYDTVLDEITNSRKSSLYNLNLYAPFSKDQSGIRETVNPETGALTLDFDLFSLPGRGGVPSVSLSLLYATPNASLEEEGAVYNTEESEYESAVTEKSDFLRSVESFGIGWRLQLPYVENPDDKNHTKRYVHFPDGRVFATGDTTSGLKGYKLADVQFAKHTETRNGIEIAYYLRFANGDIYYFNASGYPVEKTDILKNHVFYHWSSDNIPLLTSIADDSGDIIFFTYSDASVTIRHKEKAYTLEREKAGEGWLLSAITDPQGRKTSFTYKPKTFRFNFFGDLSEDSLTNTYYLLKSVAYPSGLYTHYEYTKSVKWLYENEGGKMEYAKLSERYDTDGTSKTSVLYYTYISEPDGCPDYKSSSIPVGYTYSTKVTDANFSETTYIYDKNHDQIQLTRSADGKIYAEEIRHFDVLSRMPDLFINVLYNENGESRRVYTASKFDNRGNLIYDDTYENPEKAGENVKEYAYSPVSNICVYEKYMQDIETKIEIKRTLSPGGGTVATESLYENGRLLKKDRFIYDNYGNLTESRVQNNETDTVITHYRYDAENHFQYPKEMTVGGIKNADGEQDSYTYRFSYDTYGNLTETINPDGGRITYTYDKLNRQTEEKLEDGSLHHTLYNDKQNSIVTTDACGYSLLYSYDKYGKIESVYDKSQSCYLLRRSYDNMERLIQETDARGTQYLYTYDKQDRCTSIIARDVSGTVLSEQYLSYNPVVMENGRGYTRLVLAEGPLEQRRNTVYLFDYLDRQVQISKQSGQEMRSEYFTYDTAGNCITVTAQDGGVTTHAYDAFGNAVYSLLADGTEKYFTYDFNGNCISETNGAGEVTLYAYDGMNRLTRQETTNGEERSVLRQYYDFRGNTVKTLDAENNKTEYSYDLRGFLSNVRQYAQGTSGQETDYTYDGEGRIASFSTGAIGAKNKHIYRYELDVLGRTTQETDPMGQVSHYNYEPDGNISRSTDRNGVVTSYSYDGLGRLIRQTNSQSQDLYYSYNDFGEVTELTDGTQRVQTVYNGFGDTVSIIRGRNREDYLYDQSGRVTSHTITDSDMGTLTKSYNYDALSRPVLIETDGGAEHIRYDAAGRIAEKTYPQTGRKKVYTYYENGTLKGLLTYREGELIGAESIEYDKNGNKTLWDQDGAVTRYTYDGMNRLQSVTDSTGVRTEYEFDGFGNISREYTLLSYGIETRGYEYDMNNRLLLSYDDNSSTRYSYDAAGNLTEKVYELAGQETKSHYGYDGYNRLIFFFSGNTTAEYTYNPEGIRESKTVNGSPTRFLYDGGDIVGELTADNYYLYYRGTELLASKAFSGKTAIYEQDSHGNITALLDYEGAEQKTYTYNAYGKEQTFIAPVGSQSILYQWKQETENGHNPFRYCGEYQDLCSGLIYLRNRYYDPSIGRFITEDPIRSGTNWYVYCSNNPVNLIDPLGLFDYDDRLGPSTEYNIDVKVMQNELARLGYYCGEIDGYFGQKTLDAVNAYKNAMGLGNTGSNWGVVGKQTWESMGLTYRTKDDIDAGVEISTVGLKQYKNFSTPINNALDKVIAIAENLNNISIGVSFMGQEFTGKLAKGAWFLSQVYHRQPWDIKRETPWNSTIGAKTYPGWGVKVMYNNALMTPEELGNYTYGYIGTALGFNLTELYGGSWAAAGFPISGDELSNEFNDWNSIKRGYNAY